MYRTMLKAIEGDVMQALSIGLDTLTIAGVLALGILVVSTIMKAVFKPERRSVRRHVETERKSGAAGTCRLYGGASCGSPNGCDAVYLGGSMFGARAFANNFDEDEIQEAIAYAHVYGVRVFVTVNTLIREEEFEDCVRYVQFFI